MNLCALAAMKDCAVIAILLPLSDYEADVHPMITGSVAEFYIEPMLSCVCR